uniref:Complement factor properdin n=1 Tax=Mola mola TaxID=94237 RepID=A0A3Q3WMH8_MOLML
CVCVCVHAECVRCFARFDQVLGECNDELGDVDEDDCCQNPRYGYQDNNDTCKYCGSVLHGGWSGWSNWLPCSGSCISSMHDIIIPTKKRSRYCSNPAPSNDTVPPGNRCPGDNFQVEHCSEVPNCPVDGSWGAWSPARKCSVTCGEGLQLSTRICDLPAPKYGGRTCLGPSTRTTVCQNTCPVDGFWSGWSSWGECSSSCIPQGKPPTRTRHRSCSNPAPSSSPPGRGCQGDKRQIENCNHLPYCPVNGDWGSWSPFSSCPVTCGVGLQVSTRKCDSPAPNHGGQPCQGATRQTNVCKTKVHCPVDGMWSEWSSWTPCKFPFGGRVIHCKHLGGSQTRERQCIHRAHNGSICSGDSLTQRRVCYDVNLCYLKGTWEGWEPWSLCNPSCGETSSRSRRRYFGLLPKGVSVSTGGKCWLSVTDVCWDNFNQGPEFLQQTEGTPELSLNTRTHVFVLTISLHGDEPEVSHSLNKCPLQT